MPLAVTHVLLTIIAVDIYRDYIVKHKKHFTLWTIFIAGVAGLLPDADIPITFVLSNLGIEIPEFLHGQLLHTPFFGLLFLIPAAASWMLKKHKLAVICAVICFGIVFHVFLDYALGGGDEAGSMLLYPLSEEKFKLHLLLTADETATSVVALDAIILLAWLFHEEYRHRIKDFI